MGVFILFPLVKIWLCFHQTGSQGKWKKKTSHWVPGGKTHGSTADKQLLNLLIWIKVNTSSCFMDKTMTSKLMFSCYFMIRIFYPLWFGSINLKESRGRKWISDLGKNAVSKRRKLIFYFDFYICGSEVRTETSWLVPWSSPETCTSLNLQLNPKPAPRPPDL